MHAGGGASLIGEARPRGRPLSGVCGWPLSQLVLSSGRGGAAVGGGGVSRRSPSRGDPRAGSRGEVGDGEASSARRETRHRTPQLGLREGARSREGEVENGRWSCHSRGWGSVPSSSRRN